MYKHHDVQDSIQHQYFRKPVQLTRKEAIKLFLWNPKTSECFGRTASSWGECCAKKGNNSHRTGAGYINRHYVPDSISVRTRKGDEIKLMIAVRGRQSHLVVKVVAELSNLKLNVRFFSPLLNCFFLFKLNRILN